MGHRIHFPAESGLSENPFLLAPLLIALLVCCVFGWIFFLILQRVTEYISGDTKTSVRELLLYTSLVAALFVLVQILNWLRNG
jgi:cobalamin synthase